MAITIQNIPFFCLIWIGIGFLFVIIGILMMASHQEDNYYTKSSEEQGQEKANGELTELFSFFLQEEEKKNEGLRKIFLEQHNLKSQKQQKNLPKSSSKKTVVVKNDSHNYNDIIKLYGEGHSAEKIAKKLKKGVGEVNLMISLYAMNKNENN